MTESFNKEEDSHSGYNSGDEYLELKNGKISTEEWMRRDDAFCKLIEELGLKLRIVGNDGACLFRSIALQIYGDEEMHDVIRQSAMDHVHEKREYFGQFIIEDIDLYIQRKRNRRVFGNHIEIQAISEVYNRTIEVYSYHSEPINIFNSEQSHNEYPPLRISYHRACHFNAILDPHNNVVGVGLSQGGLEPKEIKKPMFGKKVKTRNCKAKDKDMDKQRAHSQESRNRKRLSKTQHLDQPVRKKPRKNKCDATMTSQSDGNGSRGINVPPAAEDPKPQVEKKSSKSKKSSKLAQKPSDAPVSPFYQELLDASYAKYGNNEDKMVQEVIEVSKNEFRKD